MALISVSLGSFNAGSERATHYSGSTTSSARVLLPSLRRKVTSALPDGDASTAVEVDEERSGVPCLERVVGAILDGGALELAV